MCDYKWAENNSGSSFRFGLQNNLRQQNSNLNKTKNWQTIIKNGRLVSLKTKFHTSLHQKIKKKIIFYIVYYQSKDLDETI